jgi:glycerate 2-kinase
MNSSDQKPQTFLRDLYETAVNAVLPQRCLVGYLPSPIWPGRTLMISVGKAGASMAQVASAHFGDSLEGLVVIPAGHDVPLSVLAPRLDVIEAGHPVPNENSILAAKRAMEMAESLGPNDRLIALISGGGSALLAWPVAGVCLEEKQALTKALLASGASITQINIVRKHLSQIKGGRLAMAAAPANVETYLISDIPGDDPNLIASGPTLPNPSSKAEARAMLTQLGIVPAPSIVAALEDTPQQTLGALASNSQAPIVVATAKTAFQAAGQMARAAGMAVIDLGDTIEGPASVLGHEHARLALEAQAKGQKCLILSGGEASVTLTGPSNPNARGGRNLEYLLALGIGLQGAHGIHAIACDTDGQDGSSHAAGAILTPDTVARAAALGVDANGALKAHQSHAFFERLGDLHICGPTRTNVNDFRAILIS